MSSRHRLLSLLVENHPGVLNKVASMIRRRGMNITSLTVGETDDDSVSRMTIAVDVGRATADQAVKQLYKLIEVVKISDITEDPIVDRELVLVKVAASRGDRSELLQIVDIFKGKIADVGVESMVLEMSGSEDQVDTFLELVRPFGIREVARSGTVAMARGRDGLRLSSKHQARSAAAQPDLEAAERKRRSAGVLVGD
ncbi:MAG: acetolactate synthase, small subunit [Chloroflexi bacterium]|nr:acetolactate synthase, small subunit [Chloroflexota bacterium]MDB5113239.1 acetolactate synthase, small subunit [Chloroflexota bacterium]MEA2618274.1 acetolactate synthase small subunit [Chloroflexota bacterium]